MLPAPVVPYIRMADYAVRTPWQTGERRLLDYLLIYFQEGACTVTISGVAYDVPAGYFCLIQPNELHTLQGRSNTITPFAHFDMFYHPRREESFVTHSFTTDIRHLMHLAQPRLNDIPGVTVPSIFLPHDAPTFREQMLKMIGTWQQGDVIGQLQSQHYAFGLILALLQQFSTMPPAHTHQPHALNWISAYCSFHLAEPLLVADLANRANLSQSHFNALFRQRFGTSPHQYVMRLRIQRAQELLQHPHHSLTHIAQLCGFADVHHFSKAFKRLTTYTPGAYRALMHQQAPHTGWHESP